MISNFLHETRERTQYIHPIRVGVTYRVCQNWRAPIFARLASSPQIEAMIFHGRDIPGTKIVNTKNFERIPHCEMMTYHFRLRSSGRESQWMLYPDIVRQLNRFRPDVLLCEGASNIFNNILIYAWAWATGTPTIWWTLGFIPGRVHRGLSALFMRISDTLMKRSSVLLGYSSRAKRYFEMRDCRQPQFIAVNCVDTDLVTQRITQAKKLPFDLRKHLGFHEKQIILFVGALTREKRVDDLLFAYEIVRRKQNEVALIIVGDGEDQPRLTSIVSSKNIPDVHFAGRIIDEVSHYFLAADLFVLPGLGGLAISEAMAHGLPVICTVADGCEEDLVAPGINGFVLREGDIQALSGSILALLDSPERLREMGEASLNIIHSRFNVQTYYQSIMDAIQSAYALR